LEEVECRKCARGEILYVLQRQKDGANTTQSYVSSGLVRCDRTGRGKRVSRHSKDECMHYEPRRQ